MAVSNTSDCCAGAGTGCSRLGIALASGCLPVRWRRQASYPHQRENLWAVSRGTASMKAAAMISDGVRIVLAGLWAA